MAGPGNGARLEINAVRGPNGLNVPKAGIIPNALNGVLMPTTGRKKKE